MVANEGKPVGLGALQADVLVSLHRHVASDAVLRIARMHAFSLITLGHVVAFEAAFHEYRCFLVFILVRIVARGASKFVALLEATTQRQPPELVGGVHTACLGCFPVVKHHEVTKVFSRSVGKGRFEARLAGTGMALSTNLNGTFSG